MNRSIYWIILMVCWGAFILIWLAGWLYNLFRGPKVQRRLMSLPVLTIGAVLILIAARSGLLRSLNLTVFSASWLEKLQADYPVWLGAIGVVFLVPSAVFTLWARFTLGTMWSNMPEAKIGHQLRTDGPYGVTRHPIYTGMIGMLWGSLLIGGFGASILIALVGTAIVLVKVPAEERLMIQTFGEQYRQYQRRVPQLIPGLQLLKKSPSGMSQS
jgi:protein-S-isoprenylcysteine O-methyltransferase Ste14